MTTEPRTVSKTLWRTVLPIVIAACLVIATIILSGSALLRIEDVTVNRILAGTYGKPDWRVHEMNPLLAWVLSLFYAVLPFVNWYGVLLLGLLLLSAAAAIGLAARKAKCLLPVIVIISPLVVLLSNAVISTAVCALSVCVGALLLMDAFKQSGKRLPQAIAGLVLFFIGAMLSLKLALVLAIATAVCFLLNAYSEKRIKGLLMGLPIMAILLAALFGFETLMLSSPELTAYRDNYARYEGLLHSSLNEEQNELLSKYGVFIFANEEEAEHDHVEGEEEPEVAHVNPFLVPVPANSFDAAGWSLNDASLFFSRYASDSELIDPAVVQTLSEKASFVNLKPFDLLGDFFATAKKPQFLLLIGLLIVTALAVVVPSRRKGLVALLAVLFALGGHFVRLATYYDTFADIAPFYLVSILILLYHLSGEDLIAFAQRVLKARWLRAVVYTALTLVFTAGLSGLVYYTRVTPANANPYTLNAVNYITEYVEAHPEMLFVGDNPRERFKPDTLKAPARGSDENLLAGSYDLYSPRQKAQMEKYGITNPLLDCLNRNDIGYILMSFETPISMRLTDVHEQYVKAPITLAGRTEYSEAILSLMTFSKEEIDAMLAAAQEQEAAELAEDLAAEQATLEASPSPSITQTPDATPNPGVTQTPAPSPSLDPVGTAAPETTQGG